MSLKLIGLALVASIGLAQSQIESTAQFEVASIRRADPLSRAQFEILPGGVYRVHGAGIRILSQQAYDVRDYQIEGIPSGLLAERYDIMAKTTTAASPLPAESSVSGPSTGADLMRVRLQALLMDRFGLRLHRETRELRAYSLVVAKGGPRMTENRDGNDDERMQRGTGHLKGTNVSMRFLAVWLSRLADRQVLNETGLKGNYDFELNWVPDSRPSKNSNGPDAPPISGSEPVGPSIYTAVQEQLGLRLETRKGPVEILVIDHAEKPSQN